MQQSNSRAREIPWQRYVIGVLLVALWYFNFVSKDRYQEKVDPIDKAGNWASMGSKPYGPNAEGKPIAPGEFAGAFLWVHYTAPWCGICRVQIPEVSAAIKSLPQDVKLLTLVTSSEDPDEPASAESVKLWAAKHQFDPAMVVADHPSYGAVPRHVLFSPSGETLFRAEGLISGKAILDTINDRRAP